MSTASPRRMCARCLKLTDAPVTVAEVHGDSGPGWNVYACPDCAPAYGKRAAQQPEEREEGGYERDVHL